MTDIKPGDFGTFVFDIRTKQGDKLPYLIEGAEVTDTDRWYVQLTDLQGMIYLPRRDDIKDFKPVNKINC